MKPRLFYVLGDATDPIKTPAVIAHVCNDIGGWGRGFVTALSAKNPTPEKVYRSWHKNGFFLRSSSETQRIPFELGQVQYASFGDNVQVANMIAQHGVRWEGKVPPIRYEALGNCLRTVYAHAQRMPATVHMPRIGCVLAGGKWEEIAKIIEEIMTVDTVVYTLPEQKDRWDNDYRAIDDIKKELEK